MATAAELLVADELDELQQVAETEGWRLETTGTLGFRVRLQAADKSYFWLSCEADQYSVLPPIWRWCDELGHHQDDLAYCPKPGSAFFHNNGVICAPWNRLAYKNIDSRGPHSDWNLVNWKTNSENGHCRTLSAMVIRMSIELARGYSGRVKEPEANAA